MFTHVGLKKKVVMPISCLTHREFFSQMSIPCGTGFDTKPVIIISSRVLRNCMYSLTAIGVALVSQPATIEIESVKFRYKDSQKRGPWVA